MRRILRDIFVTIFALSTKICEKNTQFAHNVQFQHKKLQKNILNDDLQDQFLCKFKPAPKTFFLFTKFWGILASFSGKYRKNKTFMP